MRVEWDERKAEANSKKHGVNFEEAVTALMDPQAITFVDDAVSEEQRDITIGYSARNRLLIVVHTERKARCAADHLGAQGNAEREEGV